MGPRHITRLLADKLGEEQVIDCECSFYVMLCWLLLLSLFTHLLYSTMNGGCVCLCVFELMCVFLFVSLFFLTLVNQLKTKK